MRDAGHRTPDAGHRTSDGEKSKNNISTPQGGGHNKTIQCLKQMHQQTESHNYLLDCSYVKRPCCFYMTGLIGMLGRNISMCLSSGRNFSHFSWLHLITDRDVYIKIINSSNKSLSQRFQM